MMQQQRFLGSANFIIDTNAMPPMCERQGRYELQHTETSYFALNPRMLSACHHMHVASTIQQNLPRVLWSCSAISEFGICRAAHFLDPWPKSTLAGRYSFSDSPARALCDWHDARAYQFAAAVSLNIRRRVVLR